MFPILGGTVGKLIFTAHGTGLKITSLNLQPFVIENGICELFEIKTGTYRWKLSDTNGRRSKAHPFNSGPGYSLIIKSRLDKFTIVAKNNSSSNTTQFIGKLDNIDDCTNLVETINEISKGPNTNKKWLSAKENLPTPVLNEQNTLTTPLSSRNCDRTPLLNKETPGTPLSSKRNERIPFCDVSAKHDRPFTSSSQISLSPYSSKEKTIDDDVKITATGGRKTTIGFYGSKSVPGRAAKMNLSKKHLSSNFSKKNLFGTFKERKDEKVANKVTYTDHNSTAPSVFPSVVGFSNLGNTCYMNSILQCLLNIPNFFQDLNNRDNLDCVRNKSLYNSLCNLGILKYSYETLQNQRYALQRIKDAISAAADRFSGYAQHDAHEFLCQCLDQLKEDLSQEMKKKYEAQGFSWSSDSDEQNYFVCPIKGNYESTVTHAITCQECNEKVLKNEVCHDFSLNIPAMDENFNPKNLNINDLLERYFLEEVIEYTCEKCKGTSAILSHQFSKLPRVLILHIKRYDIYDMKRSDQIGLPKSIGVDYLVKSDTFAPKVYEYDRNKFKAFTAKDLSNNLPEKRKSNEPLANGPLNKSSRQAEKLGFENSFKHASKMEGEHLAQACRDSKRDEELRKVKCEDKLFTKLKPNISHNASTPLISKKSSNLVSLNDDNDFEKSLLELETDEKQFTNLTNNPSENNSEKIFTVTDLTSVKDDEEEQYAQAIELSLKEFENSQREQYVSFTDNSISLTEKSQFDKDNYNDIEEEQENEIGENLHGSNSYKLVGVVNHHGQNTGTGHYTSDSYDFKSNKWRHYNDSTVKEVKENEVRFGRRESAYIVFYMHVSCFDAIANKQ